MNKLYKRILAIDYGEKKSGIAFADGPLADPIEVIHHKDAQHCIDKLQPIFLHYNPDCIVVGMPHEPQADIVKSFVDLLKAQRTIPVEVEDEGYSTKEARMSSLEAGISRKKRKNMEDAYSAAIILQKYLDNL
jgi:putative Holliday junction resolvase